MEFLLTLLISLILVTGTVLVLCRGHAPVWRPERKAVLELMQRVQTGEARHEEWAMFIGVAIMHDPELEAIRQRCVVLHEGDEEHPPAREGLAPYLYDREARERLARIQSELEQLIAAEPFYRCF